MAAVAIDGPAYASPVRMYNAIDLGTLGGQTSRAIAVNNLDHVVGTADTATGANHPFLWRDGTMTDLNLPTDRPCVPTDVNDLDQVVGWCYDGNSWTHAFFWDDGVMTDLSTPGELESVAWAINNWGQAVGFTNRGDGTTNGLLWQRDVRRVLPLSYPWDINDRGQIVGETYLLSRGRLTDIGVTGRHINNQGWVAQYPDAVLWRAGTTTDLGTFGGIGSDIVALNDRGRLLIHVVTTDWQDRMLLWHAGRVVDLAEHGIVVPSGGATPNGLGPIDINNRGHMAGTLNVDPNDTHHAVLWR
jgi:probable HAF family extracellular repeat protein